MQKPDLHNKRTLTGIKSTGTPHIGNYIGAIKPALELTEISTDAFLFIADYHSLISEHDPVQLRKYTVEVAATWLACGLDAEKAVFYRQSDVPETFELEWILACFTAKGLMNRAHSYKAAVARNEEAGEKDKDSGVNMGLYSYPVLMAADILLFDIDLVPVGEDQIQHIEIARDIAQRINNNYKTECLRLPNYFVQNSLSVVGVDGRKMSKSYNNTIQLFVERSQLRKQVMKFKTDSSAPEEPKDAASSPLFAIYKEFATPEEIAHMEHLYAKGTGWGDIKQNVFEAIDKRFAEPREKYKELVASPHVVESLLQHGAERARKVAQGVLNRLRAVIGIS